MTARRFILFVLTIFMLQLSWTAVAAYCEHETGRAAQHFGHHSSDADLHQASSDKHDKPAEGVKKSAAHSHCPSCAHFTLSMDGLPTAIAALLPSRAAPLATSAEFSSSYTARPERPQWISVA